MLYSPTSNTLQSIAIDLTATMKRVRNRRGRRRGRGGGRGGLRAEGVEKKGGAKRHHEDGHHLCHARKKKVGKEKRWEKPKMTKEIG